MVRLSFIQIAPAPITTVWAYFSKFENIADWEPNTKKITPLTEARQTVGAPYKLITIWKGQQSELQYQITEIQPRKKIAARGQNKTTIVVDEIFFEQKGQNTQITYVADISLKHILKIFTPFIKRDLEKLATDAQQGMQAKIKQLYK